MNVHEIVDTLNKGETVTIHATDAFEFMRECERHAVTGSAIKMEFSGRKCVMRISDSAPTPLQKGR